MFNEISLVVLILNNFTQYSIELYQNH